MPSPPCGSNSPSAGTDLTPPDDASPTPLPDAVGFGAARRHLFLCVGPDCCGTEVGLAAWEHLKARCRNLGVPILRTKAACFRICTGGPWLLVYPEGAYYGAITPARIDRILAEHVVGGRPVTEWLSGLHPLRP